MHSRPFLKLSGERLSSVAQKYVSTPGQFMQRDPVLADRIDDLETIP